jgi:hypothetical protein
MLAVGQCGAVCTEGGQMAGKFRAFLAPVVLALVLVPGPVAVAASDRTAPPACTSWVQMTSRNPGAVDDNLSAVTALSSRDVWTVGEYFAGANTKTLIEHWNGRAWKVVQSPNKGTGDQLNSVYAVSPTNIWAAGSYFSTSGRTLIEHWNGKAWKIVASPNVGPGSNGLTAVRGTSAHDIWAVGDAVTSYPVARTVILHWNGRRWQLASSPSVANRPNFLTAVRPLSATEAWAVGRYVSASGASRTLTLLWSKGRWRIVASPNGPGTSDDDLRGVLVSSAVSAWAVGDYSTGAVDKTLILHWNGHRWQKVFSPNLGSNDLNAIGATSAANIYAVGTDFGTSSRALVLHWNGSHWRTVQAHGLSMPGDALSAVFALSPASIWAVGVADQGSQERTLIEHCR